MSAIAVEDALFSECTDVVWLPRESCATASQARYAGYRLLRELDCVDDDFRPSHYRVSRGWLVERPDGEYDEWPWKRCDADTEGAVAKWEVRVIA